MFSSPDGGFSPFNNRYPLRLSSAPLSAVRSEENPFWVTVMMPSRAHFPGNGHRVLRLETLRLNMFHLKSTNDDIRSAEVMTLSYIYESNERSREFKEMVVVRVWRESQLQTGSSLLRSTVHIFSWSTLLIIWSVSSPTTFCIDIDSPSSMYTEQGSCSSGPSSDNPAQRSPSI